MKKFNDFAKEELLDGSKVKISDVLDKEICILNFKIRSSKYQDKSGDGEYAIIQFTDSDENGQRKVLFTGSSVIKGQLEKYSQELPFITKIIKIDKYYTFS